MEGNSSGDVSVPLTDDEVWLEKYKLIVQFISSQNSIFWTVFSIFMATNALLISGYIFNFEKISTMTEMIIPPKVAIPLLGVVISVCWLIIASRDLTLRHKNIGKAKLLVGKIDKAKDKSLDIWLVNGATDSFKCYEGLFGKFGTWWVFLVFVYVVLSAWIVILAEVNSNNWLYILLLIWIFASMDMLKRKKCLNEK